jgi:ABC-type multidrug transport system fused ATPase/permease subunit
MSNFMHIGRVIDLLTKKERIRLGIVTLIGVFMALIEVIGVGSIMPFMSVAAKPEVIHTNPILARVYQILGFSHDLSFIIFLGVIVLFFLIVTNLTQAFMHYTKTKFTSMRRHTLSMRLLSGYLGQNYTFFLNRNSHELVKNINNEIQQMISLTLIQFVEFVSRFIQVAMLTVFLLVLNPLSTIGITGAIVVVYGTIYTFTKKLLKSLGAERFELFERRSKILSEAFWGIKDVKITGTESVFVRQYHEPSKRMAMNETVNEIIGDVPKFALETVAFSSIMVFVLITLIGSGQFSDVAGTVTLYAYAGYRMIPAVQGLFKALTKLKYGAPTAERLVNEFSLIAGGSALIADHSAAAPLSFKENIELRGIRFAYPGAERPVLSDFSLHIASNSLIGIAGSTGSGKTTLIDIILGLLRPQSGAMLVDGIPVTEENIRSWQANLGYIPQNIYLSDTTIAENIAFGVPIVSIDREAVKRAASLAQIADFIEGELPNGYDTTIGERGVRLSGGQRQRIGIARALYRNPRVLIMDEATSALDGLTEQAVMEAIDSLQGSRTIIIIAHRLTTLRKCDRIYVVERGSIVDSGTFADLTRDGGTLSSRIDSRHVE